MADVSADPDPTSTNSPTESVEAAYMALAADLIPHPTSTTEETQ